MDRGRTITRVACTDPLDGTVTHVTGIGTPSATATLTVAGQGVHALTCTATASDGQVSSAQAEAKIDTGAPQVSVEATAGGAPYSAGTWSRYDVALDYTCSDDVSGIATCPPDETLGTSRTGVGGYARDVAGNAQSIVFGDVKIDDVPPETSITGAPANSDTSATFTFTGTDQGGTGLAGFWCQLNSDAPAPCDSGTVTYQVGLEGYTFAVWAIDGAGNTDPAPATWKRSAPVVSIAFHPNGSSGWFKVGGAPATGTVTASNPGGTISSLSCTDTAGGLSVTNLSGIGTATATADLSVTGDGVHTLTCTATGGDGVISAAQQAVVRIDTQPPQVTIGALSNGESYTAGTCSRYDVSLHFTCTDSGSGIKDCPMDLTYSAPHTAVRGIAKDKAGNQTNALFGDVKIDKTPPTTQMTVHPPNPNPDDHIAFIFTGDDAVGDCSGVGGFWCRLDGGAAARCDSGTVSYDVDRGSHTFEVWAVDALGNEDATPETWTWTHIDLDLSIDPFLPNGSNGWFMQGGTPATTTLRASYEGGTIASILCTETEGATVVNPSGLGTSAATATLSVTGEGVDLVTCWAKGGDGVYSTAQQALAMIDTVAPSISPPTATTNGLPYTVGAWTKDDVSLAFTCADFAGSGVTGCGPDRVLSQTKLGVGGSAVDAAGNPESITFGDVKIDKIAPDTSITARTVNPSEGHSVSFTYEATEDDESGLAGFWCKLDTLPPWRCDGGAVEFMVGSGAHTFAVSAVDAVGNEDATPATYTWISGHCDALGPVNGPLITVKNATTVKLEWPPASAAAQYETWTAHGAPYFDPTGKTCASPAPYSCAVSSVLSYEAADLGSPAVNHSYLVRAVNGCGEVSANSTRMAEFEFELVPGE